MTKRDVLLQALESTPRDIAMMVKGTTNAMLHWRPAAGQWSLADVLSHLADVEGRYLKRLQRVLDEDNPSIPRLGPDESTHDPHATFDELSANFERARAAMLTFLKALSAGQWQRPAMHETRGKTSLRFLVQNLVDHDINHLSQMAEIQQQLKHVH